jgi:hypothetical protein
MCHERWMRWDRRREERFEEERFDEELRTLLDERAHPEPPTPILEKDEEPADPERRPVEA